MFTSAKIKANRGKGTDFYIKHLSNNDYYSEHGQIDGVWKGELAKDFNLLKKKVSTETFSSFQQNINPVTNGKLTQRNVENSVRFYDIQCSAQKSVSIMSLFDDRLIMAHREAVELGMKELERLAAVRVRAGDNCRTKNFEFTGKFIYAQYHHDNSRMLDPQLHTHNVIVNVTKTGQGDYKALETGEMCRAIRYAGKTYQNALACACRRLGYEIEIIKSDKGQTTGFEIKGISQDTMDRCSRRRKQIDDGIKKFYEEHGRQPTFKEINAITLSTRSKKMISSSDEKVYQYKLSLFTDQEKKDFNAIAARAKVFTGYRSSAITPEIAQKQLMKIISRLFEREGVLQLDKILAEVQNQNLGQTNLSELKKALVSFPELVHLGGADANPYYTTRENLARERYVFDAVDHQKNLLPALTSDFAPFSNFTDGFDHGAQIKVIKDILESRDRFTMFRGVAGAGKTSTLLELCKGLKKGGISNIHVIAPTNSAVDVLRSEQFESAETVASFLQNTATLPPKGSYLIIDETGLNSLRQGADVISMAQKMNYRVLFVGDERQHKSVEAGDFFRLLEEYTKINRTALVDIHRQQKADYREGVFLCATGRFKEAFEKFDSKGYIHEGKADYLKDAAESFMKLTENGSQPLNCIVAAPTIAEGEKLTEVIRNRMKVAGHLKEEQKLDVENFQSWRWTKQELGDISNYRPGYHVFFTCNMKHLARAGERFEIQKIEEDYLYLTNGRKLHLPSVKHMIDVGEKKILSIMPGDLVRFTVNYRSPDFKFNNGSIGIATENPGEYLLLDHNRKILKTIRLPKNFTGLKYGWVMTSHSSQGMTAKNVVVAAEKMAKDAFYVSLSRGKQEMALHVPEKKYFKDNLLYSRSERLAVADLVANKEIAPVPEEIWKKHSPDRQFLTPTAREMENLNKIKSITRKAPKFADLRTALQMRAITVANIRRQINAVINQERPAEPAQRFPAEWRARGYSI